MMYQQDSERQVLEDSCSSVCPSLAAGGRWDAYKHDVSRINVEANFGAGSGGNEQREGGAG